MDNLVFKGKTKEELCQNTLKGLKILEKNNLYIKESKCYWEVNKVPFLGHIVGKGYLWMEATKVKTILEWEMPKMFRSSMDSATFIIIMFMDTQRLPGLSHV